MNQPPEIFSDRQTAAILQKAAEMQAERGGRVTGLSLDELRQIAAEAGIEPELVDAALVELRKPAQTPGDGPRDVAPRQRKLRRGQTRWEQSVELPVRLDIEDVRAVLSHLEMEFGGQGTVTEMGCGTVWTQYRISKGQTHAAVEARPDGTRLHLALDRSTQRKFLRRTGGFIGFMGVGMIAGASGADEATPIVAAVGMAFGNVAGRVWWRVTANRWAKRLDRVVSMLSGEALRNGTPVQVETHTEPDGTPVR